jgi:hypothetical protein
MSADREQRVAQMIAEAPVVHSVNHDRLPNSWGASVRNTLREAFSGSASPRAAIKAQCLVCVGYDRESIKNCTGWSCPLWTYRPFQASKEGA